MAHARNRSGFTLVELIVGVGLFSLLMLLVVTAFFYMARVQKNIESKQQILNDFRTGVDVMVKEMTSGSAFTGPGGANCDSGCSELTFSTKPRPDMPARNVSYRYDAGAKKLMKAEQKTYGICRNLPFDTRCYQPFHSSDVKIDSLAFYVGNKPVLYLQPVITIEVQGKINPGRREEQNLEVTTSVTPRLMQDPSAVPPTDNVKPLIQITSPTSAATWSTSDATVDLGGTSSDNVGVTSVSWRNQTTGASGFAVGLNSWSAPGIVLKAAVNNTLVVTAEDADGNVSDPDTLVITSTAPPPPPATPLVSATQNCGPADIDLTINCLGTTVTRADIYKCSGAGCTPTALYATQASCAAFYDTVWTEGTTYGYSVQTWNGISSSGMSAITYITPNASWNCPPAPPPSPPACSDGADNDGDTRVDMGDPGCSGPSDTDETDAPPPPSDSFTIYPSADLIKVGVGGSVGVDSPSNSIRIFVSPVNNFSQNVTLSLSSNGGITGLQPSIAPGILVQSAYNTGSSFFVTVPDNTTPGIYTLRVRGVAQDGRASETTVYLDVFARSGGQR